MPEAAPPSQDPFQLCGTTIEGKYRIASVVGDGGFGVVYRAVHKGFGELIAVKCLKIPHALDEKQQGDLLEQLREEGRLLHRLSKATSGIVQALDVGAFITPQKVWVPYLVLEWLEGETLAEHLQGRASRGEGGYSLAEAIRFLEPAARALAVAHAQKVAHRDVKPPNLFVTDVGGVQTIKVLDFGIAKVLTDSPSFTAALAATKAGPSAFTPRYGAPEQFNKQRGASGPWTDVFALALILVELITGRKALEGDDPTQLYLSSADPTSRPTPRTRGAAVPDAVERVLTKALEVEPKHRYAGAGEFWDALVAAANLSPTMTGMPSSPRAGRALGPSSGSPATVDSGAHERIESRGSATRASAPGATSGADQETAKDSATGRDVTVPLEALTGTPSQPAVVRAPPGERTAASVGASKPKGAPEIVGAQRISGADPMSETPFFARHSLPEGAPSSGPAARPSQATPPAAVAAPPAARRALWPWILAAAAIGGGAGTLLLRSDPTAQPGSPALLASARLPAAKATGRASAAPAASATGSAAAPLVSAVIAAELDAGASADGSAELAADASALPGVAPNPPPDMVYIAPATLAMGEGADARDVTITRGFFLERTEVTVRDYLACVNKRVCSAADQVTMQPDGPATPDAAAPASTAFVESWTKRCNGPRGALDHPINCVDFASAEGFCKWRGRRLPTESEWELAARGAEGRAYPWGAGGVECNRACYDKNGACRKGDEQVSSCPSGMHLADRTPDGIVDLAGNVAEWVSDGFASPPKGGVDPRGDAAASLRVARGGSFLDQDDRLRAVARAGFSPSTAHVSIGLRCAMDAAPAPGSDAGAPR